MSVYSPKLTINVSLLVVIDEMKPPSFLSANGFKEGGEDSSSFLVQTSDQTKKKTDLKACVNEQNLNE